MKSYPSFIHDRHRPGVETTEDAQAVQESTERLQEIMWNLHDETGVIFVRKALGAAKDDRTMGCASIVEAVRAEPPMTTEEALALGGRVVAEWAEILATEPMPGHCDMVFALPEQN